MVELQADPLLGQIFKVKTKKDNFYCLSGDDLWMISPDGQQYICYVYNYRWNYTVTKVVNKDELIHPDATNRSFDLPIILYHLATNHKPEGKEIIQALLALEYDVSDFNIVRNYLTDGIIVQRKTEAGSTVSSIEDLFQESTPAIKYHQINPRTMKAM